MQRKTGAYNPDAGFAMLFVAIIVGAVIFAGLIAFGIVSPDDTDEKIRRQCILSCLERGGTVVEDNLGRFKECHGVKRP